MKPGRPACHIKAKWIAWCKNGESTYYELDGKGNLIKSSDSDFIHFSNRTVSKDKKKKRNKQKTEIPKSESPPQKNQIPIEEKIVDINLNNDFTNHTFDNLIGDNNSLDLFHFLDQINDETTLFDQLFEF